MYQTNYFYLAMSAGLLVVSLAGLMWFRTHRRIILFSGFFSAPCSLATFFFVPEYWDPVRLFDFQPGIEDVIFSFSTGMIAMTISLMFNRDLPTIPEWKKIRSRSPAVMIGGLLLVFILQQVPVMVMIRALIGIAIIGMILIWERWWLLPTALKTGAVFSGFYTGVLAVLFIIFPDFHNQWTHANLSNTFLIGIPSEEILWAFFSVPAGSSLSDIFSILKKPPPV